MASLSRVLWSVVVVKGPIIWNVGKPPAARTEASSAVVACVPWCFWAFESKEFQVVDVQLVEFAEVVGVQLVELADVTARAVFPSREVAWRVDEAVRQMAGERITCIIAKEQQTMSILDQILDCFEPDVIKICRKSPKSARADVPSAASRSRPFCF